VKKSGQGTVVIRITRRARSSLSSAPAFQDERERMPGRLDAVFRIKDYTVIVQWLHNSHSNGLQIPSAASTVVLERELWQNQPLTTAGEI
jgi:hypothetical protein